MKFILRTLMVLVLVVLLTLLYFSGNIRSYYRFKEICKNEAGLRVKEPIKSGEGWIAPGINGDSNARYLLGSYEGIQYVRYVKTNGIANDFALVKSAQGSGYINYAESSADVRLVPLYEFREIIQKVQTETRLNSYLSEVRNTTTNKLVIRYLNFTYRLFEPDWGVGGGYTCSGLLRDDLDQRADDSREVAIRSAFVK